MLQPGNLIRLSSMEHVQPDGTTRMRFAAGRGKVFCLLLLGVEPKTEEGEEITAEDYLRNLGWESYEELTQAGQKKFQKRQEKSRNKIRGK